MTTIYWLRNDLRLHDNECLHLALEIGNPFIMVYIFDPRQFAMLDLGFRKTSFQRFQFLLDSVADLRRRCEERGGNLLILTGHPEEIIPRLVKENNGTTLIYQKEITSEEIDVENSIKEELVTTRCQLKPVWGLTLYHKDDAPFDATDTPLTSKAFRVNLTKQAQVRPCFDTPRKLPGFSQSFDWGELPSPGQLGFDGLETTQESTAMTNFPGGETKGLERLNYYTFKSELLTSYRWTRNRSLGMDYSSKFSPWMALGCLSPRQVYWDIKKYEEKIKKNASTWWMVFELVWRDYFKFLSLRFGDKIFYSGGYRGREVNWKEDTNLFNKWCKGITGIPFIDAHMRELHQTGFMSNRGRVNCASFLTRDYEIDWRWGAAWFESRLLDYDVCSNWLNWNTQATEIWYTNPVHQGLKYDREGYYVSSWLPELKNLPRAIVQAPWLLKDEERTKYESENYPHPVEVYKKWSRSINNIQKARTDGVE